MNEPRVGLQVLIFAGSLAATVPLTVLAFFSNRAPLAGFDSWWISGSALLALSQKSRSSSGGFPVLLSPV